MNIFLRKRPEDIQRLYALIDEQSNSSMISAVLAGKLEVEGKKERYFLSTCNGSKEVRYGRRVSGLTTKSLDGKFVRLPTCTECDNIPEDKREIPTPEIVEKFVQLREIASEIPAFDPEAVICLLIGRDAPELLKVRSSINGPKGALLAQKLLFGWTVCGQVCLERSGGAVHISTNRITIYQPQGYPLSADSCQLTKSVEPHCSRFENPMHHKFIP